MMRLLFTFLFLLPVFSVSSIWAHQGDDFFPYHACFVATPMRIKTQDYNIFVEVKIDKVLLRPFKKGAYLKIEGYPVFRHDTANTHIKYVLFKKDAKITMCMSDVPQNKIECSKLNIGQKSILAFSVEPRSRMSFWQTRENKFENEIPVATFLVPYSTYSKNELNSLLKRLKNLPETVEQKRASFKKYLESRWTIERINDFCRPENQRNWLSPFSHPWSPGWEGTLYENKPEELSGKVVSWTVAASNSQPVAYAVNVTQKGTAGWELEFSEPRKKKWTDEDFLLYRFSSAIEQAFFNDWCVNKETRKAHSKLKLLFLDRTEESIARDGEGREIEYRCRLGDGSNFRALLSKDADIRTILINSKQDPIWNKIYSETLQNLRKSKRF